MDRTYYHVAQEHKLCFAGEYLVREFSLSRLLSQNGDMTKPERTAMYIIQLARWLLI